MEFVLYTRFTSYKVVSLHISRIFMHAIGPQLNVSACWWTPLSLISTHPSLGIMSIHELFSVDALICQHWIRLVHLPCDEEQHSNPEACIASSHLQHDPSNVELPVKSFLHYNLLHGDVNLHHGIVVPVVHNCNNFCFMIWECLILAILKNLVGICHM